MEVTEAIVYLEGQRACICSEDCQNNYDFTHCEQGFLCNDVEALNMAIEALERQIPKKPEFVEDEYLNSFKCYCPQCGFYFGTKGKHSVVLFDMPKYCPKCGQVTDWSDAE